MKNLYITVVFILLSQGFLHGQPVQQILSIQIAPSNQDYLYKEGEIVKFDITVLRNDIPAKDVEIRYEISEDMMSPHKTGNHILKDGKISVNGGTLNKPGFLRCHVYAKYRDKEYLEICTVGFSPLKIKAVATLPDDFLQFWGEAKKELSKLEMDVRATLVPEQCTEKVNVYHISLQNYPAGSRLYGMIAIPRAKGKYPAILRVPGAGIRSYRGDVASAEQGIIVFRIGIHGIPVNLSDEVYKSLSVGALRNYRTSFLFDKNNYYYKRVYLGCIRAIDYIYSLSEFDGENLITYGGSQGGALSIVTAALDKRIKGLVAFYPALCDLTGYLYNRAGGWPHLFKNSEYNSTDYVNTAQYYDVVNFARQIQVPGFYSFGYNDMKCPPTTVYSAINDIKSPKEVLIEERTAHYMHPEQKEAAWNWVLKFFNLK